MKKYLASAALACGLSALGVLTCFAQTPGAAAAPAQTTITVNANNPASYKIPRTIFGSFLEPIGNSTYGGLWAEILQNPSFEEGLWSAGNVKKMLGEDPQLIRSSELGLPLPWEPLDYTQENRYEPRWNDAANSYRSMFVMGLPGKQVGIRQKVYLPAHRTLRYTGSVYAKYTSGSHEVEISIRKRNRPEITLARSVFQISGDDWKRYEFTLDVPPGNIAPLEAADFVIAVGNEGRVLIDQASLFPADSVEGMDPDIIALAKAMKSPNIRFGGNFTSAYHWRDGIGPRDKRVSMLNVAWGIPEYNTFGTDEFLRFCTLVGARPQIALNLGTGTPDEAAGWVKYVNEHWEDHSGGLLWELGNELWGSFQVGYPTIERVAHLTSLVSQAVRKVDPKASLIGTGGDEDSYHDWNAAQLGNPSAFNYLSTHFVVGTSQMVKKNASPDFLAQANFALPVGLERKLREMHQQIQANPDTRDKVRIALTEWLLWAENDNALRYDNMGGAIGTAGFLNMLMRVADFVPISDMTGIIYFGGIGKERGRAFGVPAYWAFRMYSNADVSRPVETRSNVEKYDVEQGSARLPSIPDVPYLDVVAALNESGDTMTLFCVNRHLTRDIAAQISLEGFDAAAEASAQTLYAASIYDKNDEMTPEAVHPRNSKARLEGSRLEYNFRHESITVLTLRKAK